MQPTVRTAKERFVECGTRAVLLGAILADIATHHKVFPAISSGVSYDDGAKGQATKWTFYAAVLPALLEPIPAWHALQAAGKKAVEGASWVKNKFTQFGRHATKEEQAPIVLPPAAGQVPADQTDEQQKSQALGANV